MGRRLRNILLGLGLLAASAAQAAPFTLAFGACLRQYEPQPVWKGVLAAKPDVFVFGGDNVYTDTGGYLLRGEPARIGVAYGELAANPDFARLRKDVPVYATWDDHDYGRNDAGAEYPYKAESKAFFMVFFGVPADAPMRSREGIYDAHWLEHEGRRIQLILLDTRSFRSPLVPGVVDTVCPRVRWARNEAPDATVLGAAQWAWLEQRLAEPADVHVVVSGIQVIPTEHCYEKWANFPHERRRLLGLLADASAPALVLSGDRHLAEISQLQFAEGQGALLELTSSGMNSAGAGEGERNRFRVKPDNVREDNFATLSFDWTKSALRIGLAIRGADGGWLQQVEAEHPLGR